MSFEVNTHVRDESLRAENIVESSSAILRCLDSLTDGRIGLETSNNLLGSR